MLNALKTKLLHKYNFYQLVSFTTVTKQTNFSVELIFYLIFEYVYGNKHIRKPGSECFLKSTKCDRIQQRYNRRLNHPHTYTNVELPCLHLCIIDWYQNTLFCRNLLVPFALIDMDLVTIWLNFLLFNRLFLHQLNTNILMTPLRAIKLQYI